MIIDIFKYFAQFPAKRGTEAMATLGQSEMPEYSELLAYLATLPSESVLPEIDHYVYAQSFDELQKLLQRLTGSFLMVDYGEITFSSSRPRTLQATQQIAVTIATKASDRTDSFERLIINERTLRQLNTVYAHLLADSDSGSFPWADRDQLLSAQFVPFVATELGAVGWTMMLDITSTDPFDIR